MATLGTVSALGYLSLGGSAAKKTQGPPIQASSPDEESFIKYVYLWENNMESAESMG